MIKDFNKIVNKMLKKWWNVIFKKDIYELIDPECKPEYSWRVNTVISRLKSNGHIISLKAWVYIVPESDDTSLNDVDLVEKYYLKLLKKYITSLVWSHYYISGVKSLEFHMKNNSIPERIYVINKSLNKKIYVWSYEICFKTLSGKQHDKKYNLYNIFSQYSKKLSVDGIDFKISWLELSLLEAALVHDSEQGIDISLLIKAIKKYGKVMDYDVFQEVGKYKYNMSFNRLKEIAKTIDRDLYKVFLDVIKKNGGCFVGEGLRGI